VKFTLDQLNSVEFEQFSYELLQSLDFVNLSWRKGTGYAASPADQGRDIQAQNRVKEVDGKEYYENWFIECKHYIKGIPPEKLQGALSWASAERPDVLLFIASNYLSNAAKNYIDRYKMENKPSYRIKIWELPDLENLTVTMPHIRRKYNLSKGMEFLTLMDNSHLLYVAKPHINTIKYFLQLMDGLDPIKRDQAFGFTYSDIIQSRLRKPVTGEESIAELRIDPVDYTAFREKCLNMKESSSPNFVHKIVTNSLAWLFQMADKTMLHEAGKTQLWLIEQLEKEIRQKGSDKEKRTRVGLLEEVTRIQKDLPQRYDRYFILYTYICSELVRKLLIEKISYEA